MNSLKRRKTFIILPKNLYGTPKYNLLTDYIRNTQWLSQLVDDANTPHIAQYLDGDGYKRVLDECTHLVIYTDIKTTSAFDKSHYIKYALENGLRVFMIKPDDFSYEEITL